MPLCPGKPPVHTSVFCLLPLCFTCSMCRSDMSDNQLHSFFLRPSWQLYQHVNCGPDNRARVLDMCKHVCFQINLTALHLSLHFPSHFLKGVFLRPWAHVMNKQKQALSNKPVAHSFFASAPAPATAPASDSGVGFPGDGLLNSQFSALKPALAAHCTHHNGGWVGRGIPP